MLGYYETIILMFHFILLAISLFCAFLFFKKSTDEKNTFSKISKISIIIFCLFYSFLEAIFIKEYFIEERFYLYELCSMIFQVIFITLFMSSKFK